MRRALGKAQAIGNQIPSSIRGCQPRQFGGLLANSPLQAQGSWRNASDAVNTTDKSDHEQTEDLSHLEDPHYGDRPYKDLPPLEGPDAAEIAEVRWSTFLLLLTFGTLSFVGWYWFKRFSWTRDPGMYFASTGISAICGALYRSFHTTKYRGCWAIA